MAKSITIRNRRESDGSMIFVSADLDCTDSPWLGQPFLAEDLGLAEILEVNVVPRTFGINPTSTTFTTGLPATQAATAAGLSIYRSNLVTDVELVGGFTTTGLNKVGNMLTTAAVATTGTNSGSAYAAGGTSITVQSGLGASFTAGDIIALDYASITAMQYAEVLSISTDTLTLKYGLAFASSATATPIAIVRKGIGTGVTLSSAVTLPATTIAVSSATGMMVGDVLGLSADTATGKDASELVLVRSISGTTITVESLSENAATGATAGCKIAHASGDKVYKVPHPMKIRYLGATAGKDVAAATAVGNVRITAWGR